MNSEYYLRKFVVIAVFVPSLITSNLFADTSGINQVDSFLKSIINVVGGLAALVAALFFVVGGYQYMSSLGNPERMERAKRTLVHAGVGLSIVIGSFVIANIISGLATSAFGN